MKEVQLKPGQYPQLVRDHEKPILLIAETKHGYVHKDFATAQEALTACKIDSVFSKDLICVYNLTAQEFIENEVKPTERQKREVSNIIAYYLNK
jgi:hypothetical protein